jgi:hypothetical protein
VREEYDTYQYVEAPSPPPGPRISLDDRGMGMGGMDRRRSRSITYESNPRVSNRVMERERVVVEDAGRRREFYRRP